MRRMTEKPTTIIAVRHGETEWNRIGRQQGHLDSPLTPLGRQQALSMADTLSGMSVQLIFSSDLGRAQETATIIAARLNLPVRTDARLRERNLGILEGQTMSQFRERHPSEAALLASGDPDFALPSGESARQRFVRNVRCVEEIARMHAGNTVLVVAHGGVLHSFFHRAVQLPLETRRSFSLYNAAVNVFTVADSGWRLETWGDVSHLRAIPTLDLNDA
jgi:2,3-bisphosphoglycerate-dependent phosphoglycerate mutase